MTPKLETKKYFNPSDMQSSLKNTLNVLSKWFATLAGPLRQLVIYFAAPGNPISVSLGGGIRILCAFDCLFISKHVISLGKIF